MKIAYCTRMNPHDKRSWSGTHYTIMRALKKEAKGDVVPVGPITNRVLFFEKIVNKVAKLFTGKKSFFRHSPIVTKEYARQLLPLLKSGNFDVLFFPSGGILYADLKTDVPIVALYDATAVGLINYYPGFSNLTARSEKNIKEIDQRAVNRATHIIYSSQWAADSAMRDYGCPKEKISIIPFGANIHQVTARDNIIKLRQSIKHPLKLLFVGVEWERKGGWIAYETLLELLERGIDAELTICGCLPPENIKHDKMRVIKFLDKNDPSQAKILNQLYLDADFFLLPTRNECSAIVLCEAAAYGLPAIATMTGGIPTYIDQDETGFMLPLEAKASEYADVIEAIRNDRDRYVKMAINVRDKFERELNWDVWGQRVAELLKTLIRNK